MCLVYRTPSLTNVERRWYERRGAQLGYERTGRRGVAPVLLLASLVNRKRKNAHDATIPKRGDSSYSLKQYDHQSPDRLGAQILGPTLGPGRSRVGRGAAEHAHVHVRRLGSLASGLCELGIGSGLPTHSMHAMLTPVSSGLLRDTGWPSRDHKEEGGRSRPCAVRLRPRCLYSSSDSSSESESASLSQVTKGAAASRTALPSFFLLPLSYQETMASSSSRSRS